MGVLRLVFKPFLGATVVLGPLPSVVIVGDVIQDDSAALLAHYEAPYWIHGGAHYVAFEIDPQARVVFVGHEMARKVTGQHREMHFADGMLYAGTQSLARFDAAQRAWVEPVTQQVWPRLEIQQV